MTCVHAHATLRVCPPATQHASSARIHTHTHTHTHLIHEAACISEFASMVALPSPPFVECTCATPSAAVTDTCTCTCCPTRTRWREKNRTEIEAHRSRVQQSRALGDLVSFVSRQQSPISDVPAHLPMTCPSEKTFAGWVSLSMYIHTYI
jgi:hypothetical protein